MYVGWGTEMVQLSITNRKNNKSKQNTVVEKQQVLQRIILNHVNLKKKTDLHILWSTEQNDKSVKDCEFILWECTHF